MYASFTILTGQRLRLLVSSLFSFKWFCLFVCLFQAALIMECIEVERHKYTLVNIPGTTVCTLASFCSSYIRGDQIGAVVLTSAEISCYPDSYALLVQCNHNQSSERRHEKI